MQPQTVVPAPRLRCRQTSMKQLYDGLDIQLADLSCTQNSKVNSKVNSPWGWNGCWGSHQKTIGCMCSCHRLCCSGHACRVLHQSFAPILRRRQAASGKRQAAHTRLQTACNMQHTYEKQEARNREQHVACRPQLQHVEAQQEACSPQHSARNMRHAANGMQPAARTQQAVCSLQRASG